MEINVNYNESNLDTMAKMPDNFIDLTVTSPPYDNLRTYNGYSFDFENIAKELYRVTKDGGVVVWIVADQTVNGSESCTSFRQALKFVDAGFNLHDTMIYHKAGFPFPEKTRYNPVFEYMFVFSKEKPKTFNKIKDRENIVKGFRKVSNSRFKNGKIRDKTKEQRTLGNSDLFVDDFGMRYNIWKFTTERGNHPAIFPSDLANDHIISWSNEGDIVYDCFMGSGTTAKMAKLNNRNYIGSEISEEYCGIIEKRLTQY